MASKPSAHEHQAQQQHHKHEEAKKAEAHPAMTAAPAAAPASTTSPTPSVQNPTNAIDFAAWIEASKPFLLPPVCNRLLFGDGQLKVMVVGGPNIRNDYHLEEGEEFFYQLKGDMCVKTIEHGKFKDVPIKEGEAWVLPGHISHSPQRYADTIGLVIERERDSDEKDALRWFVQNAASPEVLYQEFFHCEDLGTQLKPVIERFHASEAYKINRPAANAKQDPPVRQDNSITLSKPIKLADATSQAAGPVSLLWNEREFKIQVVKPGDVSHRIHWERESESGEVLFYQLDGETVVSESNGTEQRLGRNFMFRVKKGARCVSQHAPRSICLVIRMQVEHHERTLGDLATQRATGKAQEWLNATFGVISKTVLAQANNGLFRAVIRFEDNAPQDAVNQRALLKLLRSQDLQGTFKKVEEDAFELHITWGPRV